MMTSAAAATCDFCQQAVTRVDSFSFKFPVYQCASAQHKKPHLEAGKEQELANRLDITKLVFCDAKKSLLCTLASKFPERCNLSDGSNPRKFTIFACGQLPIQQNETYAVSFQENGGFFFVAKSCLHGATFICEQGGMTIYQARVSAPPQTSHYLDEANQVVRTLASLQVVEQGSRKEYVIRLRAGLRAQDFVLDSVYDFTHLARVGGAGENLLEMSPKSTFSLSRSAAAAAPSSSSSNSVRDFLLRETVPAFQSNAVRVFFRNLKQELLYLIARYDLCVMASYTGPDQDFLRGMRGKCAGLVANQPQKKEEEEAIAALPLACDAKARPVLHSKPLIFSPSIRFESMHSKFVVFGTLRSGRFQAEAVWTGSFNFTANSSQQCVENAVLITDELVAKQYFDEFTRIHAFVQSTQQQQSEPEQVVQPATTMQAVMVVATPPKSAVQQDASMQRSQRKPVKTPGKLAPTSSSPLPSPNLLAADSPRAAAVMETPNAAFFTPKETKTVGKERRQMGESARAVDTPSVYFTPKQTDSRSKQVKRPQFTEQATSSGEGSLLGKPVKTTPSKTDDTPVAVKTTPVTVKTTPVAVKTTPSKTRNSTPTTNNSTPTTKKAPASSSKQE